MGERTTYIGDIIEKKTGQINQAITLDGKFVGFLNVKPNTYLMQWNNKAPTPIYIPIKKSLDMAKNHQQKLMDLKIKSFMSKGYKLIGQIFISS